LIDYNLQQPHMLQYNLTVERQLPHNMVVSVAYAGSRGLNLYGTKEGNPAPPTSVIDGREFWAAGAPRVNAFWNDMEFITAGMDSWYNSFQFGVEKRLTNGLQFKSAYTWSKALDTTQGQHGGESGGAPNQGVAPHNPSQDKGPADFDTRQSWTVNGLYQIPNLIESQGIAGKLINGWRVSTIFTAKNGLPFTPLLSGNRSRSLANGNNADHPDHSGRAGPLLRSLGVHHSAGRVPGNFRQESIPGAESGECGFVAHQGGGTGSARRVWQVGVSRRDV
jgi:hypothetical protein